MNVKEALEKVRIGKPKFGDDSLIEAIKLLELYNEMKGRWERQRPGQTPPEKFMEHILGADAERIEVLLRIRTVEKKRKGTKYTWQGLWAQAKKAKCSSPESASGETRSASTSREATSAT